MWYKSHNTRTMQYTLSWLGKLFCWLTYVGSTVFDHKAYLIYVSTPHGDDMTFLNKQRNVHAEGEGEAMEQQNRITQE